MSVIRSIEWSLVVVLEGIARRRSLTWLTRFGLMSAWFCVVRVCWMDAQAQADSGCGHELWPDMTGVFSRKACTTLGGAYLRDSKQAMVRGA
jgi:hypothetical protein